MWYWQVRCDLDLERSEASKTFMTFSGRAAAFAGGFPRGFEILTGRRTRMQLADYLHVLQLESRQRRSACHIS
jgi:hypothetical protein